MNKKSLLAALLAVCLLLTCLAGCSGKKDPDDASNTRTVTVINQPGAPVEGVDVYVYEDSTQAELVDCAKTDAEGKMTFTYEDEGAVAVIKGAAVGYQVEESYPITGADTVITLDALAPTADGDLPADTTIGLGQPMVDFTVTDVDGTAYTASEVLKEKQALVLNFWYTGCKPCGMEFPFLQTAYDAYADSLLLLGMDPYDADDAEGIKTYREDNELTIPMVEADPAWADLMGLEAYPTTVVIDRYGFVAFVHTGAITEEGVFEKIFSYYTAEQYVQKITSNVSDLEAAPAGDAGASEDNPIVVDGALTFDATVPVGGMIYYSVYKVSGTILTIDSPDAYVVYNDQVYEPVDGTVAFSVKTEDTTVPVKLVIGNKGAEEAVFTVNFVYPGGTAANPYGLVMGDLVTLVEAGNDQGVVYEHTAAADGTIEMYVTDATKGVEYDVTLFNKRSSASRTLNEDGKNKDGKKKVIIEVKKGDVVQVTVSVLPDDAGEYPAATINSHLDFLDVNGSTTASTTGTGATNSVPTSGIPTVTGKPVNSATTNGTSKTTGGTANKTTTEYEATTTAPTASPTKAGKITYKVTVKAEGKVMSGVSLLFAVAGQTKTVKTNDKGVATASLPDGDCLVTLTVPEGYIAERLQYTLNSNNNSTVINLTKEEEIQNEPGNTPTEYSVKVVLSNGVAFAGITVQFCLGGTVMAEQKADKDGVAKATLMDGTYSIKLVGTDMKYDEASARVSVAKPSSEIVLANPCGTEKVKITCPILNKSRNAYTVEAGATYVTLRPGERNYFLFSPTQSGTYRISSVSSGVKVGYYGGSIHYIQQDNMAESDQIDENGTAFSVSVKDVGVSLVLGLDAATNVEATVLLITRIGDAEWSVTDEPWVTYEGTHTPKKYTLPTGTSLKKVDIKGDSIKLVLGDDGYYHKGSKTGPLVYLRFKDTDYVSFSDILDNFHIAAYLYNKDGSFLRKEEYTELMEKYRDCADDSESVYPLTADLEYILKKYGEHQGWWNTQSPGYLFKDSEGNNLVVNTDIAWMFALYYAN